MRYKTLSIYGVTKIKKVGSTKSKISQNPEKTGMNPLNRLEITYRKKLGLKFQVRAMPGFLVI